MCEEAKSANCDGTYRRHEAALVCHESTQEGCVHFDGSMMPVSENGSMMPTHSLSLLLCPLPLAPLRRRSQLLIRADIAQEHKASGKTDFRMCIDIGCLHHCGYGCSYLTSFSAHPPSGL